MRREDGSQDNSHGDARQSAQIVIVEPDVYALQAMRSVPASRNPALVYIASLAPGSRRTMRDALQTIVDVLMGYDPAAAPKGLPPNPNRAIASSGESAPIVAWDTFPWHQLDYQHAAAVRAVLTAYYKKRTAVKMLSAMRRVIKECWRLGYITVEQYQRAVDLERVSGETTTQAQTGRHVEQSEVEALLTACADETLAGVRDAALIAVAYNCGLRRAELAALSLEDVSLAEMSLRVTGKGSKERVVYLGRGTAAYLETWLRVRGPLPGAVFGRITKADRMLLTPDRGRIGETVPHMTDQAIYGILKRRASQALVESFTPHDMRRTFAGNLLDAGADLAIVQKLMGHSDPGTTAGYDRRSARVQKDAVERLLLPVIPEILGYNPKP